MKNERCYYCEREFNVAHYGSNRALAKSKDHIIPYSKGGISQKINYVDCCRECNCFKGNLMPEWFLNKIRLHIKFNKRHKTLTQVHFLKMQEKTQLLIENRVLVEGDRLYRKHALTLIRYHEMKKERLKPESLKPAKHKSRIDWDRQVWTKEQFDLHFKDQQHFHYYAP